jgi:hypothetical protein
MGRMRAATARRAGAGTKAAPLRARRKFLRFFPGGFRDETYVEWERGYKAAAHQRWLEALGRDEFARLLAGRRFGEIAARAVRIESRTNLLFSFEKMALRDAVRPPAGARAFAEALGEFLYGGPGGPPAFDRWVEALAALPRRQTRVLTWPLATVFGFIAQPERHFFLKPMVTRRAARAYDHDLPYRSRPDGETYAALLAFARRVKSDLRDLRPRDMIDVQSFLWVQGSDEYDE